MTPKKLLELVTYCGSVIVSDPVTPILHYLLFTEGKIFGSDLITTTWASLGEPCSTFLAPYKELKNILTKLKGEPEIKILYLEESQKIKIDCGKYSFTLLTEKVSDFPKFPVTDSYAGMLTANDIENTLLALPFVSDDELRPAMTGVYLNNSIAATNGHMLFSRKLEGEIYPTSIVDRKAARLLKHFEFAEIYSNKSEKTELTHLEFTNNDKGIITRPIDETFPEFKKVIPSSKDFQYDFTLPRAEFLKAVQVAREVANDYTRQIEIKICADGVKLWCEDRNIMSEFETEVIPFGKVSKAISEWNVIGFNANFLIKTLSQLEDDFFRLQLVKPSKGAYINRTYLIMPVMINKYV